MSKRTDVVYVAMAIAVLMARPSAAKDMGVTRGFQWSPYLEWTLANPSFQGNPFDLPATVQFTHAASGVTHRTDMFFAGDNTWAFRFTATHTGDWTFRSVSEDEDLDGHTGTVAVHSNPHPRAQGFLKHIGNKWAWQGTERVFVPQLVMWDYICEDSSPLAIYRNPDLVDEKIQAFMVEHGFNGFHLPVVGGRWFALETASDRVTSTMKNPDPRTFQALETLVTRTHAAGGLVHVWPWGDHQRGQTPKSLAGGMGGVEDRRLQRYIAARLGSIPGWSMGYGFDLDEWVSGKQLRAWRDSLQGYLGWRHILGGRPVGPNHGTDHSADASWNRGLDYSGYEHHRPSYQVYVAALQATPNQPVMSEDRFRIRLNKYPNKDYNPERTRRGLYHSTLAGGVANIWGIHPDVSPGGIYPNREQIKTYSVFFHDKERFLADMSPANHLSADGDTRVLRSPSSQSLVAYREEADSIHLDLSNLDGPLAAVAVNTRRAYAEVPLGALPARAQTIALPVRSDWVLAVGTFEPPSPASLWSFTDIWQGPPLKGGHGAMWADVDADGLPDLYLPLIVSGTLPDLFMHNKGEGRFAEEGQQRGIADADGGSHGAAWCDLDNDGDYDLINGTTFDDGSGIPNNIFRNEGAGRFVEVTPHVIASRQEATRAFLSFDMDADGDLDLFGVSNYLGTDDPPGERNELYRNQGGFQFVSITSGDLVTAPAGQGAIDTDLDGDGDIDVLAANRTGPVNILTNDGTGRFTRVAPSSIGIRHRAKDGITSGDVDNDGDLDLLLAGNGGEAQLYLAQAGGRFSHAQSFSGVAGYMGGFADLDNDGDLDLYFAGDDKILTNDGGGHFLPGPAVPVAGANDPRGVAFADLDNDGDLDFAFGTKRSARNFIIRNDLKSGGHWLKVRLVGPNGQAGAFGAKTTLYAPGKTDGKPLAMRESQSNCGYLGQNDPVLHFGLGNRSIVDVVVLYLDGTKAIRRDVTSRQTLSIDAARP